MHISNTKLLYSLSNIWAEDARKYRFTCNGYNLPVRTNLRDALQHLGRLLKGVPIWIDAICIN